HPSCDCVLMRIPGMLQQRKDLFWAFGPMIWTKIDGRPQLFDRSEFFEKTLSLLKTRVGYKKTGQDELDFQNGLHPVSLTPA
ncbi:MAG: hypothetical protein ACREV8_05390, partial [Gammaproteobacteria bacterium]